MRRVDKARWGLALAMLLFGVLSHDPKSDLRWLVLMLGLYGVPLVAQGFPQAWVRVYGRTSTGPSSSSATTCPASPVPSG